MKKPRVNDRRGRYRFYVFTHFLENVTLRRGGRERSRLERGTADDLLTLREKCRRTRVELRVFIVQPGVLRDEVTREQLELLL